MKHVNDQVHATTERQARNDYRLQEDDDTEATMSVLLCNDVKLYHPAAWRLKGTISSSPSLRYTNDLTGDGDHLSSAHAAPSVSEDRTDGLRCS